MHVSPLGCLAAIKPGSDLLDVVNAVIADGPRYGYGPRAELSAWHLALTVGSCLAVWISVSAYCRASADRHLRRSRAARERLAGRMARRLGWARGATVQCDPVRSRACIRTAKM